MPRNSAAISGLLRVSRGALLWGAAAAAATALASAFGRAFCLSPYWPSGMAFRCRPDGLTVTLLRAAGDAGITTALLLPAGVAVGMAVRLLAQAVQKHSGFVLRLPVACMGALLWFVVVRALEPGYLDFVVGWPGLAAGALSGTAVADTWVRERPVN